MVYAPETKTQKFVGPSGDWDSVLPFALLVLICWAVPSAIVLASNGFHLSWNLWEGICGIGVALFLYVGLIIVLDSTLCYTVLIKQNEIVQFPWLGTPREIEWNEIERIQFLDLEGYRGQRAYRIRVFSQSTVIVFSNRLSECYDLVKILQQQAERRDIPIYREDSVGQSRLVFGSWRLDPSGTSAGIPVTRVAEISTP